MLVSFFLLSYYKSVDFRLYLNDRFNIGKHEARLKSQSILGWTNCIQKLNLETDVAFFGNSITRNSNFHQYFQNKKIINLGEGGDAIVDLINRIPMLRASNPHKVFLSVGINYSREYNEENFKKQYMNLIDSITTIVPDSCLFIQNILPISRKTEHTRHYSDNETIKEMNRVIESLCKDRNLTYIDIHSAFVKDGELPYSYTTNDGINIKQEHYKAWANIIKQYIY